MAVAYIPVEDWVNETVQDLIDDHYPDIAESELSIHCIMAWSEDGNPVKHNGYPANATIRKNSLIERAQGMADCTITIDKTRWEERTERKRKGLLDHELRHIEIQRITTGEDKGEINIDTAGRPCVRILPHDWVLGGFEDIAQRYGDDAPEVEAVQAIYKRYREVSKRHD